jgi:hypothetical protein
MALSTNCLLICPSSHVTKALIHNQKDALACHNLVLLRISSLRGFGPVLQLYRPNLGDSTPLNPLCDVAWVGNGLHQPPPCAKADKRCCAIAPPLFEIHHKPSPATHFTAADQQVRSLLGNMRFMAIDQTKASG